MKGTWWGWGGNRFRISVSLRDGKASVAEQAVMGETLELVLFVFENGGTMEGFSCSVNVISSGV